MQFEGFELEKCYASAEAQGVRDRLHGEAQTRLLKGLEVEL